jgi:TRAP-type C4-dicarboxylate transport system permease small subunit
LDRLSRYAKLGVELVSVALFTVMFGAFLLQIFSRYVLNAPLVWTLELCLLSFLWLSFWNCGLLLTVRGHIGFTIIYDAVGPPNRRILAVVGTVILGGVFAAALPGTADWISFMGIGETDVFEIPLDWTFSIFLVFMVAVIVRCAMRVRGLLGTNWESWL